MPTRCRLKTQLMCLFTPLKMPMATQSTTTLTITHHSDSGLTATGGTIVSDDAALNDVTDTAAVSASGGTGTLSYALDGADSNGEVVVDEGKFTIDSATGVVTFLQSAAYTHAEGSDLAEDVRTVTVVVTDADDNTTTADVSLDITDDQPVATLDSNTVIEGATLTVSAAAGVLDNDAAGADSTGFAVVGVRVAGADTTTAIEGGLNTTIEGTYGDLVLQADGSYEYVADANTVPPQDAADVFVYTVEDADGDQSTTTLTINHSDSGLTATGGTIVSDDAALNDVTRYGCGERIGWYWHVKLCVGRC